MTSNEWTLLLLYIERDNDETAFGGHATCKTNANETRREIPGLNAGIMGEE